MNYVGFGQTGVKVSEICLGTMTFGKEADEETSIAIMDRAFDAGIQFFDTADLYNQGLTEEIVGRWLKGRRDDVILASKVYFPTGDGVNDRGSSRLHIIKGVEASLKRLQTNSLDILYLHHWDNDTAIEESLAAISHLVDQGKILYCAVSNFSAWQTMKAISAAEANGFAPISAIQPQYSLIKRQAEVEILPMAQDQGIAVCPYSPIAAGLLSGKYQRKEEGRMDVNPMYKERYSDPAYMDVSTRFVQYAETHGYPPAALAVAWATSHPTVTSAIIGARNLEQLDTAISSQNIGLTPETRDEISALSIEPPSATDREKKNFMPPPKTK